MGLISNLLLVPLVSLLIVPVGILVIALVATGSSLMLGLAAVLTKPLIWGTHALLLLVTWLDQGSSWWQLHWSPLPIEIIAWYAVWTLLRLMIRRSGSSLRLKLRAPGLLLLVISLGAISVAVSTRIYSALDRSLRITYIDVGQGLSTVVRFPNGKIYVFDGGGSSGGNFDVGRWVVAPTLHRLQISHIDTLVMSHHHADHYGGLPWLAEAFTPTRILINDSLPPIDDEVWEAAAARLRATGLPMEHVYFNTPEWDEGGVKLRVLHPEREGKNYAKENDHSIVLELTYGSTRTLLTGDIEREAESDLTRAGSLRATDLVEAPHHGSRTSSTLLWLKRVRPRIVVISCGRHNRYHFPHPTTLERYRDLGIKVFRTDQHGAVTAVSDGRRWTVSGYR